MKQLGEDLELVLSKHEAFIAKVSKVRDTWYCVLPRQPVAHDLPLLHVACELGVYPLAKLCLQRKSILSLLGHHRKVNQKWGPDEETPLHVAVRNGSSDVIQLLLSFGADVASEDSDGQTPLHRAIGSTTFEVYKLLSGSRRSITVYREEAKRSNKKNNRLAVGQRSMLHLAALYGWEDSCQELVQHHHYNIEWQAAFGRRAIHFAVQWGHMNLAKRAVAEWGACLKPEIQLLRTIVLYQRSPKVSGVSAKFPQSHRHEETILEESLRIYTKDWGCDINAVDARGYTILYHRLCLPEMRAIMNVGLPINFNNLNNRHQTLLHYGGFWLSPHGLKIFLSQSRFHVNTRDCEGCTPLYCVSRRSLYDDPSWQAELLLDFGADRTLLDNEGRPATDLALHEQNCESDSVLVNYSTVAINIQEVELIFKEEIWP